MAVAVLETLSTRKLTVLVLSLFLGLIGFFLVGGLVGKSRNESMIRGRGVFGVGIHFFLLLPLLLLIQHKFTNYRTKRTCKISGASRQSLHSLRHGDQCREDQADDNISGINTEIKVNGQKLETVTSFKYLGTADEGSKP